MVRKNVVEGQEVPEGYAMFEVADLHTVWVQAQVYEDQLGLVREGQAVEATVEAFPGETFPGKVAFIQPHLDPATRTVDVRYDLDNPGHRLRPGMFATVTLKTPVAETPAFRDAARRGPAARGRRSAGEPDRRASRRSARSPTLKLGSMGDPIPVEVDGPEGLDLLRRLPAQAQGPARQVPGPAASRRRADEVLSVPESAVIDTGTRKVVYVESRAGRLRGPARSSSARASATASRCSKGSPPARRWRPPARS